MLKMIGLGALAAIAALVLSFGAAGTTQIRGPDSTSLGVDHMSAPSADQAVLNNSSAVLDVAAVDGNGQLAPLSKIGEISSTTATGVEDGLGRASLPWRLSH